MIATLRRAAYGVATVATMAGVMLVAAPSANAEPVPPEPGLTLCGSMIQQGGGFTGDVSVPRHGVDVRISPAGPTGVAIRVTGKNTTTGETHEEALYFPPGIPPAAQTVQLGNAYAKGWSTWSVSIEPAGNIEQLYGIEFWSGACAGDFNQVISSTGSTAAEAKEKVYETFKNHHQDTDDRSCRIYDERAHQGSSYSHTLYLDCVWK